MSFIYTRWAVTTNVSNFSVHNLLVSKSLRENEVFISFWSLYANEVYISFWNLYVNDVFIGFWGLYESLKSFHVFEVYISFSSPYEFLKSLWVFEVRISFWSLYHRCLKSLHVFEVYISFWSLDQKFWSLYLFLKPFWPSWPPIYLIHLTQLTIHYICMYNCQSVHACQTSYGRFSFSNILKSKMAFKRCSSVHVK